ncbi:hypothetical protein DFA_10486 [Cavenderia fasciculata]|uniref:Uncharacterized protein n=1 Tax=Cavenderia fasciculata TaxID=261658 RepID=F4QAC5_CACFS|nr:uncharacterized protein DFA_10486 [Cavenderia fasciculata]EGG15644.1 hypothetical protein DFA_10486 [Cavenderia fasciculata]|eukprot:XP_004354386.1 hypothetical protein DFA_10486 [Cavenderia fasciculata]
MDASKNQDKEIQMLVKGLYQKLLGFMGKRVHKKRNINGKHVSSTQHDGGLKRERIDYVASTKPINNTNQIPKYKMGRSMIGTIMLPNIEHIKRVHTDGFLKELSFQQKERANLDNDTMKTQPSNILRPLFPISSLL